MPAVFPDLQPKQYTPHPLHDDTRIWPGTNCHVDLWIEVIASLGHDPCAALGFTVLQDFEGDQFTFFKMPAEGLERLFGVTVHELTIYRPVAEHAEIQIARGRLPLIEVDGFYLPDTEGLSYRRTHTKTLIGLNRIDRAAHTLEYFHNEGLFCLKGQDFDGIFGLRTKGEADAVISLPPYVEFAKFDGPAATGDELVTRALTRLRQHLARVPKNNPFISFSFALDGIEERFDGCDLLFHDFAFATTRQFGANFELLSAHLRWLGEHSGVIADVAISSAEALANDAKLLQFQMARTLNRNRTPSFGAITERLIKGYDQTFADLLHTFGSRAPEPGCKDISHFSQVEPPYSARCPVEGSATA